MNYNQRYMNEKKRIHERDKYKIKPDKLKLVKEYIAKQEKEAKKKEKEVGVRVDSPQRRKSMGLSTIELAEKAMIEHNRSKREDCF